MENKDKVLTNKIVGFLKSTLWNHTIFKKKTKITCKVMMGFFCLFIIRSTGFTLKYSTDLQPVILKV